ncbi:uncharacterized protein LOC108833574 [Raphanus sativus]|uniref:Uncharacterized protein LOC108833574 n=1 Tax=Raphanus sativus TaxID=3726 RepID=A0A9W3CJ21_RAPSA|nr:uncharacterized protein LOC108833574 [Raphanus sativus]
MKRGVMGFVFWTWVTLRKYPGVGVHSASSCSSLSSDRRTRRFRFCNGMRCDLFVLNRMFIVDRSLKKWWWRNGRCWWNYFLLRRRVRFSKRRRWLLPQVPRLQQPLLSDLIIVLCFQFTRPRLDVKER